MNPGDFVVFFCGQDTGGGAWEYFYVGLGTVGKLLDRRTIWTHRRCAPYRSFFNVLARSVDGTLQQHELVHQFHDDWTDRIQAPYIVFDPDRTRFNLADPLHVASYHGGAAVERWHDNVERVRRVADLIMPEEPRRRGLRSTNRQWAHPKMNLHRQAARVGSYETLRTELRDLVR